MTVGEFDSALLGAGVVLTAWLIDNRDHRWAIGMGLFTILHLLLVLAN